MEKIHCPRCSTDLIKCNGRTRHGKQRYRCKNCQYQFSENPQNKLISKEDIEIIDKLLLERITLHGICRVMNVSMPWLLKHIEYLYERLPNHLNIITKDVDFEGYADEKFDAMIYDLLEKKTIKF